jgi:hypothetical protein
MPDPSRQPKSPPLDHYKARVTTDEAFKDLLLANAFRMSDQGGIAGGIPRKTPVLLSAWLSTVLELAAISLALLSHGTSADEETSKPVGHWRAETGARPPS